MQIFGFAPRFAPLCYKTVWIYAGLCNKKNKYPRAAKALENRKNKDLQLIGRICRIMVKILFVCHGNICRSPMAEFVMKDLVNKSGYSEDFFIASKATSTEEFGNSPHYGTRNKLKSEGIPMEAHRASQMDRSDYNKFDYIIGMDAWNYKNILRITGGDPEGKVSLLLDFAGLSRDIADPWYTGNFDKTYEDICKGCEALLHNLLLGNKL